MIYYDIIDKQLHHHGVSTHLAQREFIDRDTELLKNNYPDYNVNANLTTGMITIRARY